MMMHFQIEDVKSFERLLLVLDIQIDTGSFDAAAVAESLARYPRATFVTDFKEI